ncbi:hypothetical protein [Vibrio cholerae]|uniref:hypothetical protein n=1 Tax=Vibrio cholerae TaxID=666 RepID=UPI001F5F8531|nr:hypothetical protein [Vibrio cholerae]GHY69528.1 hypothetical protein VCSRO74_0459 [Vibrio cholerae]
MSNFGMKTTIKGAPSIVGSYSGGNVIQQTMINGVADLEPGHVVVIADGVITARWDGSPLISVQDDGAGNLTVTQVTLGIVTTKQMEGDMSVSTLRLGAYLRDRVVLADGSALTAANEFTLSVSHLFAEGSWL